MGPRLNLFITRVHFLNVLQKYPIRNPYRQRLEIKWLKKTNQGHPWCLVWWTWDGWYHVKPMALKLLLELVTFRHLLSENLFFFFFVLLPCLSLNEKASVFPFNIKPSGHNDPINIYSRLLRLVSFSLETFWSLWPRAKRFFFKWPSKCFSMIRM